MSQLELSSRPLYLTENQIVDFLTWPSVFEGVKQSLISVANHNNDSFPNSSQPRRTYTKTPQGVLLTMPGYIGNYQLSSLNKDQDGKNKTFNTLGCKLVTKFRANEHRTNPLPNILGTIFLFNTETGQLKGIIEGTEITEIRTAAASLVATKYLYFDRQVLKSKTDYILSIVGTGVQGRIHAIGMLSQFDFSEVRLWNRTQSKAIQVANELKNIDNFNFRNRNVRLIVSDTVEDCVRDADVIVTSTFASSPLLYSNMLKADCHINAVGAGTTHYSEISPELYKKCFVYVDYMESVKTDLNGLDAEIVGQVGDVITKIKPTPLPGITVFQSMGMGIEDAAVAQMAYEKFKIENP